MYKIFLIGALVFPVLTSAQAAFELPDAQKKLVDSIAEHILHQRYGHAEKQGARLYAEHPEAGASFWALAKLSAYNDRGDTNKVYEAKMLLDSVSFTAADWEGLRLFQLGFVEGILGNGMSAGLKTRAAAKIFKNLESEEAQAFYFIYAYYTEALSAWIPGVSDKRPEMLHSLEQVAVKSRRFGAVIGTAAVWMHFGRKEYDKALQLVDKMLLTAPEHPIFMQMRADMLFRLEDYAGASQIYEASAQHYAQKAPHSLRWWCAAGNLARIYDEMGKKELSTQWSAHFTRSEFAAMSKWMPPSLMKDLKKRKLVR